AFCEINTVRNRYSAIADPELVEGFGLPLCQSVNTRRITQIGPLITRSRYPLFQGMVSDRPTVHHPMRRYDNRFSRSPTPHLNGDRCIGPQTMKMNKIRAFPIQNLQEVERESE